MISVEDGCSALSKVQYLSSTSGGSWFNAAFSYKAPVDKQQLPLDDFFERYIEPEKMTLAELRQDYPKSSRSFEAAIAAHNALDTLMKRQREYWLGAPSTLHEGFEGLKSWFKDSLLGIADDLARDQYKHLYKVPEWVRPWTAAVAKAFLAPYHLNIFEGSTVSADHTKGDIANKRAGKAAEHVLLACTDKFRPFPILTGTAFNPPGEDGYSMYPLEFSPLYFGTPSAFADSKPVFGGGYVEPWGLNATPGKLHCGKDGCIGTVDVSYVRGKDVLHTVPLAQAVSISSSFLAVAAHDKSELAQELASTEKLVNWGVLEKEMDTVPEHDVMGFADGGSIDNLAVMPLLRRGVRCMIVFMASATPPDDTWERFATEKSDIAALFGAARVSGTPGVAVGEMNDMCHVFGKTQTEGELLFRELFEALHSQLRAGKPGYHRTAYMVKENSFFNIPASKEPVEVLWIHNQQWKDWERLLPQETQTKLLTDRKGRAGDNKGVHHKSVMEREKFDGELEETLYGGFLTQDTLYRFPYFTTYSLDYSADAVKMLGQLCTAVLLHPDVKEHITKLVAVASEAKGQTAGPAAATAK